MKKITRIALSAIIVLFLAACQSKEETSTYTLDKQGVVSLLTYYYVSDKVTRQTVKNTINYQETRLNDEKSAKELFKNIGADKYNDINGITHSLKYNKDEVIESIEIDFSKLDYEKAKIIPGVYLLNDSKNGVSMEKTKKIIEKSGFVPDKK